MKVGHVVVSELPPPAMPDKGEGREAEKAFEAVFDEPLEWAMVAVAADEGSIEDALRRFVDVDECSLVITTGGIGPSEHAITPDATLAVIVRELPGLAEAMRAAAFRLAPESVLSRAVAGIRANTLILNLPSKTQQVARIATCLAPAIAECIEQITSCRPKLKAGLGSEGIEPPTYWV